MNRAEQLKLELQAQRLRLDQETRQKAELLQKSYEGIGELNFLGWSPRQLEEAKVPLNFLKSAWQYKRMPSVERVERVSVAATTPSAPSAAAPARPKGRNERPSKKAKRGLHWDSEWVAPVTQKFGDNNWSSSGLVIDCQDSSDDEQSSPSSATIASSASWTEQESALKASIESYKIDIKALTNHIRQTSEALSRQQKRLDEKRIELSQKQVLEAQAIAKLKVLESRRSLSLAQEVNGRRADVGSAEPEAELEAGSSDVVMESEGEPEGPGELEELEELGESQSQEQDVVLFETETEPSVEPEKDELKAKDEPEVKVELKAKDEPEVKVELEAKDEPETEIKIEPSEPSEPKVPKVPEAEPETAPEVASKVAPEEPTPAPLTLHLPGPRSPLAMLNKYRLSPLWTLGNPAKVYSRTYNSFAVQDAELCPQQLAGRQCAGGCDGAHFEDWDVSHTQVLRHILENYLTAGERRQFKAKLKTLANPDSTESMALLQSIYCN